MKVIELLVSAAVLAVGMPAAHAQAPEGKRLPVSVTSKQRTALLPLLEKHGWKLPEIETQYTLSVNETPAAYELTFTAKGASGVTSRHVLDKASGAMSGTGAEVPAGAELTAAQRATVDRVLVAAKRLWIIGEDNVVQSIDVARGAASLTGTRVLDTRARAGTAVLYLRQQFDQETRLFVMEIALAKGAVTGVGWFDPPRREGRYLTPAELAFLEKAFAKQGDQPRGFRGSAENGVVTLRPKPGGGWSVSTRGKAAGGSFETFTITASGDIGTDGARGHYTSPRSP